MKRTEPSASLAGSSFWALAVVFAILIVAAGMRGGTEPNSSSQTPSSGPKCITAAPEANTPMTAAQGAAILRELRAIRELLQNRSVSGASARLTPRSVKMRVEPGWHELGSNHAPVTMVEFTDLQCPFCRRFQTTTFAALEKDYIDTGKARFIALDFPLPLHAYAMPAAEAEHCAGDQGKFWQFRDAVLDDHVPPTSDVLQKHARELDLNLQRFQTCLASGKYRQLIQAEHDGASALGVHGVPAFVIGRASGGSISGALVTGARPFLYFQQEIESALSASRSESDRGRHSERANSGQYLGARSKAGGQ